MASYFRSTVQQFLSRSPSEVLAELTLAYASDGFSEMRAETTLTWWADLDHFREALHFIVQDRLSALDWVLLLEFTVPRKGKRLDAVLLDGENIFVLECKTGMPNSEALLQVETYALLLHYFHKPSDRKKIIPIVVSAAKVDPSSVHRGMEKNRQRELGFDALPSYWIAPSQVTSWEYFPRIILDISCSVSSVDGVAWDDGAYHPTPTIIEAALALKTGLKIREVAHSEASEHEVEAVVAAIQAIVAAAKINRAHSICFVTGVPGSGKTLVGLSLAHLSEDRENAIHFMSGNGPLVAVLQEVFRRQAMRDGVRAAAAKIHAETLIENIHVFAKLYTEKDAGRAPSNHVIIFDEAQRAWNLSQNLAKFKRNYSEPEMLLKIMERHQDWACVIALVGGGQEINSGEAGLEEWGKAISESMVDWKVFASPEVILGGTSTAGQRLFSNSGKPVATSNELHLRTSNRSLRADNLAAWVNFVLLGDSTSAAALKIEEKFPLFLSRDLSVVRAKLRRESLGESRYGLAGSSGAARLRAEGLEPSSTFHAEYPWHHWYLSPREDVRSSYRCEVFATEFEIQGLELDWIGVCWGGDLTWGGDAWEPRDLRHGAASKWGPVRKLDKQGYRRNAYRVLLTRARQGMVIYVPVGDASDPTRSPQEFNRTADYLLRCGVRDLDQSISDSELASRLF